MQTELLFELTYIILERQSVTASEMAEHFGVSQRTIYRWVDALDLAGVPVVTTKGKGGGIRLAEKYTLDKAVLTEEEKLEILSSVQAFQVLSGSSDTAVSKLKAITKATADWIKIDFAPWNPKGMEIRELFSMLKNAVLTKRQVKFDYYSSRGECSVRTADPWKIVFRGQAWYLYGFCHSKKEPRYFKLNRMQNTVVSKEKIEWAETDFGETKSAEGQKYSGDSTEGLPIVKLKLWVSDRNVYRILDEFSVQKIEDAGEKGYKILEMELPEMYWLKSWFLSFGSELKILEPERLRKELMLEVKKMYEISYFYSLNNEGG